MPIRLGLVGLGKIARDQHLPAIAANSDFTLTATASRNDSGVEGVAHFKTLPELLANSPKLDAVALCMPPQARFELAQRAIAHGLHVFLEKPPGATVSEVELLRAQAASKGVTLFASWHSRYATAVAPAREWLSKREIKRVSIVWREDVRVWHPGQAWIWEPGGFGVFDPGINALSIATHILPQAFFLKHATLEFPENRAAPIAAKLAFTDGLKTPIDMDLDWRQTGPQTWDITVETADGTITLSRGGSVLTLPGAAPQTFKDEEYPNLYRRFAALIETSSSDADVRPLQLVADAFLLGKAERVEAFED